MTTQAPPPVTPRDIADRREHGQPRAFARGGGYVHRVGDDAAPAGFSAIESTTAVAPGPALKAAPYVSVPLERPLVFLDTETTSLGYDRRIWEVAMIRRNVDGTEQTYERFIYDVDLAGADPQSLRMNHFRDRHPKYRGDGKGASAVDVAKAVELTTWDATIVAANPTFDIEGLSHLLRRHRLMPMWHYRPIDVEALAAGHLGYHPGGLTSCAEALGIHVDPATEHTALADARVAMAIYDAILGGAR